MAELDTISPEQREEYLAGLARAFDYHFAVATRILKHYNAMKYGPGHRYWKDRDSWGTGIYSIDVFQMTDRICWGMV